jgi:hypothetical protein
MKLLTTITTEDRLVIISMALTLSGVILGARLAEPRAFGVTAIIVIGLLFIARSVTHSPRLSWLLVFGLVAGSQKDNRNNRANPGKKGKREKGPMKVGGRVFTTEQA